MLSGPRSLAVRLALVAGSIGIAGVAVVLFGLRAGLNRDFEQQTLHSAFSVTEMIRRATRSGMLRNEWTEVNEVIENIGHRPDVVRIRLMNKKGDIVFSSDPNEVRRNIPLSATECRVCHESGRAVAELPREERFRIWRAADGNRVLGMIEPVPGGPECAGSCHHHSPNQRVLGVIDAQLSLAAIDRANSARTARLIWAVLAVQLTAAVAVAVVVGWLLRRRMSPMLAAIGRLGGGDFTTRVDVRQGDEVGQLASSFNSMAEGLQHANAELEGWTRTLQSRVDEKTRELQAAQDHMVRSERLACLGRLAAVVAHELNNPLAGVQVYVRRARKALGKDDVATRANEIGEWMETVDREVGRCGRIVQDLLSFSRQRAPHRAPLDVNEVIRRATRLLGHKLDLEEIDLALRLDESLEPVVADADQVEQALLALLINAVEAMPRGGMLEVTSRAHIGGGVEIEVRDSGGGIPADVMPHIFEPFFTTKPEGQGTGLGLSVVYGIVTRHGGRLDIDSVPSEGTTVTLFFPPNPAEDTGECGSLPESPDATKVTR